MRIFLILGTLSGLLGVVAGAVGAHVIKGRYGPVAGELFDLASSFQLWHALALLGTGLLIARFGASRWWTGAGWLFVAGTLLFCGGLYLQAIGGGPPAVVPLGGVSFLAGWLCLLVGVVARAK
jgi:uncharacterized membrane protein YgdD (TMEM256/DUF423 family)